MSSSLEIYFIFIFVAMNSVLGCVPPCLVYAAGQKINALELTSNKTFLIHYAQSSQSVAIDISVDRKQVYWSDFQSRSILRAFLNGTGVETIVPNSGTTGGLVVDWLSDNLYWTNSVHKRIGVSRLDGTHRSFIISTKLDQPLALALDPEARWIFWSDNGNLPKIEKATLVGSDREVLVVKDIHSPNALSIDYNSNPKRLYWTDVLEYAVESIELDGSNRKRNIKLDEVNVQHPFGITLDKNNFYLSDWKTGSIHVFLKENGHFQEVLRTTVSGQSKAIMGIAMIDNYRQPKGSNPCSVNNGGCSHVCLADRNGQNCFCQDGVHLNPDGKSCSKSKDFLLIADSVLSMIISIPLDSKTQIVQPVIYKSKHTIEQPVAVDYDEDEDKVYWSDTHLNTISRAFLNGSSFEIFRRVEKVEGIDIDSTSRTIYWTDMSKNTLESSRLDGTSHKVLLDSSYLTWPRGICASPLYSFIFWTEWNQNPRIGRITMDGLSKTILIDFPTSASPNSLALYPPKYTLYFTINHGQIMSYDLNTMKAKILNKDIIGFYRLNKYINRPFGLAMDSEYLYWTEWTTKSVYGAKRETGEEPKMLAAFLGKPAGIKAYFAQKSGSSPPTIYCPSDHAIYNKNRFSPKKFSVKLPNAQYKFFEEPTVECSPSEISLKDYGDHKISCTAKTINGTSDSCSYRIIMKDYLCSRLLPPLNGKVKCTTSCTVTCNEGYVLAKSVTAEMTCYGARWRPKEDKTMNLIPVCLVKRSPTGIEITSKIRFKKRCGLLDDDEIAFQFRNRLKEIVKHGQMVKHTLVDIRITDVSVTCSNEKYLLTKTLQKVVEIHFALFLNPSINRIASTFRNPEKSVEATKHILFDKVNDGTFTLTVNREKIETFENSFNGNETADCNLWQIEKSYYCLKCSFGMYFNKTTRDCEPCSMGYYQDKEGQTSCRLCPMETSTIVMGTKSIFGCYGGKEILANISVDVTKIDVTILKNAVVDFVVLYCQKNKFCLESNKILKSFGPIESLSILPSDVVIVHGYPKESKERIKIVALFVVASFENDKPVFFPRKKLHEILIENHAVLERKLGGDVIVNPTGKTQRDNESSSTSKTTIILGVVVGVVLLVVVIGALLCWRKYAGQYNIGPEDNISMPTRNIQNDIYNPPPTQEELGPDEHHQSSYIRKKENVRAELLQKFPAERETNRNNLSESQSYLDVRSEEEEEDHGILDEITPDIYADPYN